MALTSKNYIPDGLPSIPSPADLHPTQISSSGPHALCSRLCDNVHMATNLAISPELLERALAVSGKRTKTAAVTLALQEFIARREQRRLLELFDSLDWDPTFDYKAERSRG